MDDFRFDINRRRFLHCFSASGLAPSELTELYLHRLRSFDRVLFCVVDLTEEIARRQARQADDVIQGPDGRDNTVMDLPFNFDATTDVSRLRVGYLRSSFEGDIPESLDNPEAAEVERATRTNNRQALDVIRSLGIELVPFDLPDVSIAGIDLIRFVETAAFFEDATRRGDLTLVEEGDERSVRPIEIRSAWFTPAVAYIQANRYRMRAMQEMAEATSGLDLFVGSRLPVTNHLGNPVVALPSGFVRDWPTSLHLTGRLFADAEILELAHAFQRVTDHHLKHPPEF